MVKQSLLRRLEIAKRAPLHEVPFYIPGKNALGGRLFGFPIRVDKILEDGEDAPNVVSGVEFLHRVNEGERPTIGDHVIVIGGGDTAIDAARVCLRLPRRERVAA